ncbi:MAG: U32 family peptidase C-terminal domain-containing protein, partial [Shewanella sp.]|nr:U32 family peptidase C-terminal domain-containing protein [Shewanella sp.]
GLAEIDVKNKFLVGDSLEMMTPQGNINLTLESLENRKGEAVEAGLGSGHTVYMPVPADLDLNAGILLRNLPEGMDTRNPHAAK